MAVTPSQAMELFAETKIEQAQTNERTAKRDLAICRATQPNNALVRLATATTAAASTAHADTMIGDGKGDGVKIGTIIGAAVTAGVAWKTGHHTIAHTAFDVATGTVCGMTAIITRENGLKAALIREQKRAAEQAKAATK
jgi:hypothetical protein